VLKQGVIMTKYEDYLAAVKNDSFALKFVPEALKTAELCGVAVKNDSFALKFVPDHIKLELKL
jgi:hypothetical protein